MINKDKLDILELPLKAAIQDLFALAKRNEKYHNDYVVFLANGGFDQTSIGTVPRRSPFVIDYRMESYKDSDRVEFYVDYLNTNHWMFYQKIDSEELKIKALKQATMLEMMIYCHIWESYRFLFQLRHLANFVENKPYDWRLNIQEPNPNSLLASVIASFRKKRLAFADFLSEAYNKQIRDAFAHSNFSFGMKNSIYDINLWNFDRRKGGYRRGIKMDEWDTTFALSVSLVHFILEHFYGERTSLIGPVFDIYHPNYKDKEHREMRLIGYNKEHDNFYFL